MPNDCMPNVHGFVRRVSSYVNTYDYTYGRKTPQREPLRATCLQCISVPIADVLCSAGMYIAPPVSAVSVQCCLQHCMRAAPELRGAKACHMHDVVRVCTAICNAASAASEVEASYASVRTLASFSSSSDAALAVLHTAALKPWLSGRSGHN